MAEYEIEKNGARLKLQMQQKSDHEFEAIFESASYLSDLTKISEQHYMLRLDGKNFDILTQREGNTQNIHVNGKAVSLSVLDARARQLREISRKRGSGKSVDEIKAPMPGLVLQVQVKEGDHIEVHDSLLVIEAMKMENEIRATAKGVVKKVNVREGQAVDKGALLLRIE